MQTNPITYEHIVEHGLWLEDRLGGRFSRYALGEGDDCQTHWVDHKNEIFSDPADTDDEE